MNDKIIKKILIGVTLLFIFTVTIVLLIKPDEKYSNNIPKDYIAVFHGGVGERTYSTYIYKIDNGHANYGFEYINTTNTTKSWGSTEWESKVTDKGKISWTDGAFKVAKENNAYSYVEVPGDKNVYTIEEFQKMFIMN